MSAMTGKNTHFVGQSENYLDEAGNPRSFRGSAPQYDTPETLVAAMEAGVAPPPREAISNPTPSRPYPGIIR